VWLLCSEPKKARANSSCHATPSFLPCLQTPANFSRPALPRHAPRRPAADVCLTLLRHVHAHGVSWLPPLPPAEGPKPAPDAGQQPDPSSTLHALLQLLARLTKRHDVASNVGGGLAHVATPGMRVCVKGGACYHLGKLDSASSGCQLWLCPLKSTPTRLPVSTRQPHRTQPGQPLQSLPSNPCFITRPRGSPPPS
jgi:hypothetical protein